MKIVACNSNLNLSKQIADYCKIDLTKVTIKHFADKEIFVEIEENIRGEDVFVIQSTSCPANDHLMELLIAIDALKRGSARRITAVMPYFGYARQDRKTGPRTPITSKLVADLLSASGLHRVLTMDLHAGQIQGFFDVPVDNLFAAAVFLPDIEQKYKNDDLVIVSPDVGGVVRARALAKRMKADLAIIDKRRDRPGVSEVMNIIGEVKDRVCIIMDDIVDSAGTLCNAAKAIMDEGAKSVSAYTSHGVLSGPAIERIIASPMHELVITDSIASTEEVSACSKIRHISISSLLGEAINRIHSDESVSSLFV